MRAVPDAPLFVIALGIVVSVFGAVGWMIVRAIRLETALQATEARPLREGACLQATVLRVHPRRESAWVFEVQFPMGGAWGVARIEQLMTPHIAGGLHPGRAVLVRVDPRRPTEAVFDLAAMGYVVP